MSPSEQPPIRLRPSQVEILAYNHGKMGISAVPGSGKTWTLSLLAANLITQGVLGSDQEILIVTLVNSAVNNFYQRVSGFISGRGLIPNIGYRVRTLHGLANDIVHERPDLAGLEDGYQIIDENEADLIRGDIARAWLQNHPDYLSEYLSESIEADRLDKIQREQLPGLIKDIALSFIRYAKDLRETPERLASQIDLLPLPLPLARMGCELYASYQRALAYRGAVDFDDLIRLALLALESDAKLLERLRYRWPYILEDEAQDSSALQEQILSMLSGPQGNWVRVGDPNQAIYETFTTANPDFLRNFIHQRDVTPRSLPESGRSTASIIDLANELVRWTISQHPHPQARDALQAPPFILPTAVDDPQPNPSDELSYLHLATRKFTPADEIKAVADSLERWLPDHRDQTIAVLAPRNQRAFELADELRKRSIPYLDDFLRSSTSTRTSAGSLAHLLRHLSDPQSASRLAQAFLVWRRSDRNEQSAPLLQRTAELIRKITHVEDYIWPASGYDWLPASGLDQSDPESYQLLLDFRHSVQRWHGSIILPIDQLILFLSQDVMTTPAELAIAHKLALLMRQTSKMHPDWRLPQLSNELVAIARNERRFLGFSDTDTGFNPDQHRGVVVISTLHKAKGLEWDRIYLMSVNNYDFPSGQENDSYISEKWYLRPEMNLQAETLGQLKAALSRDAYASYYPGVYSAQARVDYIRERLRLLYVGITRARKELIISWNSGRLGNLSPATPFLTLADYVHNKQESI